MRKKPPFSDIGLRRELMRRLNDVPGVVVPDE